MGDPGKSPDAEERIVGIRHVRGEMTGLRPRHEDGERGEENNGGGARSEAAPQGATIIVAPLSIALAADADALHRARPHLLIQEHAGDGDALADMRRQPQPVRRVNNLD